MYMSRTAYTSRCDMNLVHGKAAIVRQAATLRCLFVIYASVSSTTRNSINKCTIETSWIICHFSLAEDAAGFSLKMQVLPHQLFMGHLNRYAQVGIAQIYKPTL
jgi:hypothetical protein